MKISPPCEVSMWEIIFVLDVLLTISSMTERPERRKLVRQEDCLELTSVGVIRKLPEQWCSSVAVLPLQAIGIKCQFSCPAITLGCTTLV